MEVYRAYGQEIQSEFDLGFLPSPSLTAPALTLTVQHSDSLPGLGGSITKLCQSQGQNVYVRLREGSLFIRIAAFVEFDIQFEVRCIHASALRILPDELLRYWFFQQVVPLYLVCGGFAEFLHGMAVGTDLPGDPSPALLASSCVAFLGESYAGKSTLLSYLLSRGHSLVCDDHLAVSRADYRTIFPATPYYRPYRAGQDLGHVSERFSPDPLPLRRIYLLEPVFGYSDVALEELTGLAAVASLLPHIQYNLHNPEVPHLFPLVEERFKGLNALIRGTSIKRLFVPRAIDRLGEVYDFIQRDLVS